MQHHTLTYSMYVNVPRFYERNAISSKKNWQKNEHFHVKHNSNKRHALLFIFLARATKDKETKKIYVREKNYIIHKISFDFFALFYVCHEIIFVVFGEAFFFLISNVCTNRDFCWLIELLPVKLRKHMLSSLYREMVCYEYEHIFLRRNY